jgi:hypothetical protein
VENRRYERSPNIALRASDMKSKNLLVVLVSWWFKMNPARTTY